MKLNCDKHPSMAGVKLNAAERKELEKFTKVMALKSAQIIVQSRLGEKVKTHSNPQSTAVDWMESSPFQFNISITDLPDVMAAVRKVISESGPQPPMCIEISLQTVDGDEMVLEAWLLSVTPDQCDLGFKMACTVYNRIGILLKSLISVTRVTPAYKLSRRQGPDSFVIFYKVYVGEANLRALGEGYKEINVGRLCTPVGTICLSVLYRTKMTISPNRAQNDTSIMVKSDHFHPDLSPKHVRYRQGEKKKVNLEKPMRAGAFVDMTKVKRYTESDFVLPEDPPLSWLLNNYKKPETDDELETSKSETESVQQGTPGDSQNGNDPFQPEESKEVVGIAVPERRTSFWSTTAHDDDKLMKELHLPFATAGSSPIGELARFYRECYHAPPLQTFSRSGGSDSSADAEIRITNPTPIVQESEQDILSADDEDDIADIARQLELFETSLQEYDTMVTSLCHPSGNGN